MLALPVQRLLRLQEENAAAQGEACGRVNA